MRDTYRLPWILYRGFPMVPYDSPSASIGYRILSVPYDPFCFEFTHSSMLSNVIN
ncbi:Protein of unknown function [Pyronema omphalodes CBS 100304]|uniref:Uncharacterized protein n=1 Tax=Pyronema omphalodes (strain CBS 100304) TaxID=1076935 RepID=U4L929_PYROM|nr:Protein of unknown function [Pyronema omphalodes CBS 100304]